MNAKFEIAIVRAHDGQRQTIIDLLEAEKLPVSDLPASLDNFFIAQNNRQVVGAIGLEVFSDCGLLRSMVVRKEYRNQKVASLLVNALENFARASGITCMYLLTETAAQYFENKNYKIITRDEVPGELHASSEFSHVCPVSAIVMKKQIV